MTMIDISALCLSAEQHTALLTLLEEADLCDLEGAESTLSRASMIMRGYGVESLTDTNRSWAEPVALYVNVGESYAPTLLHDVDRGQILVTSWADWWEEYETESGRSIDDEGPQVSRCACGEERFTCCGRGRPRCETCDGPCPDCYDGGGPGAEEDSDDE